MKTLKELASMVTERESNLKQWPESPIMVEFLQEFDRKAFIHNGGVSLWTEVDVEDRFYYYQDAYDMLDLELIVEGK